MAVGGPEELEDRNAAGPPSPPRAQPPPPGHRDHVSGLPPEILVKIFVHLDPRDIAACSRVSREFHERVEDDYLWHKLLEIRFGRDAVADDADSGNANKSAFVEQSRLVVPANKAGIVHLNGRYWEMIGEMDGLRPEGGIAHLRNVCWFHVEASLKAVPTGRYHPVWRLNVDPFARCLNTIKFSASTDREAASSRTADLAASNPEVPVSVVIPKLETQRGQGWFDLVCPVLDVSNDAGLRFMDVHLFAIDYSGVWKNGLYFANVSLRRVQPEDTGALSLVDNAAGSSVLRNIQEYVADMGNRILRTFTGN